MLESDNTTTSELRERAINLGGELYTLEMNLTHEFSTSPILIRNVTLDNGALMYIYLSFFCIEVILSLPINFYVLWFICTGKGSGIVVEFFSLNLAVCEILFCLGCLLFIAVIRFPTLLSGTLFILALAISGRALINCAICIERYLAVLHPVSFLRYKPLRYRLVCSAAIWVMVLVMSLFCIFAFHANNNIFVFLYFYTPLYVLIFFVTSICSLAIFRALKSPRPGEKGKEREESNHMKKKAIRFILVITVMTFFQYAPGSFAGFLCRTLSAADFGLLWCVVTIVAMSASHVSPLLYIYRVKKKF
ncbi:chemokine XC receptor 1 [Neoarius graeffei]|uniref:chemokine XC receptor 1 n=1 Tax=Neoarius graeffei TaxID=443677 RepID=UPI00298D0549|nr:chemokine XC receptor 1 [Neoarius graeffei]